MATWDQLSQFHGQFNATHNLFERLPEVKAAYDANRLRGDILQGRDVAVTDNKYPWHLAPGISQKIIWSKTPLTAEEINSLIPKDAIWFKNSPECQSQPDIWHCHVFITPRKSCEARES
jgi:hypothetical protein